MPDRTTARDEIGTRVRLDRSRAPNQNQARNRGMGAIYVYVPAVLRSRSVTRWWTQERLDPAKAGNRYDNDVGTSYPSRPTVSPYNVSVPLNWGCFGECQEPSSVIYDARSHSVC